MATCSTTDLVCNAVVYTQQMPAMVAAGCTALSWYTYNPMFFIYGFFLWACQVVLWASQAYFLMMRPVPFSAQSAFPCIEAFYVSAVTTTILVHCALFRRRQGWFLWGCLFLVVVAPCFVLVFFQLHTWWQVCISLLIGSIASMCFTFIYWLNLYQTLLYLQFVPPLSWFGFYGCTDWFKHDETMMAEHLRLSHAFIGTA
jgi:hypothetical protein